MRILGLTPARGGSKGIPGKNIKIINGKPLIAHTIEQAMSSGVLDTFAVSTDDEKIAETARRYGAEVPFIRPADLATDKAPTLGVIQHALEFYRHQGKEFDAVCLLQATSPMRTAEDIRAAIAAFEAAGSESLISVIPVPHEYNPHWTFVQDKNSKNLKIATGEKEIITRRQELPQAYIRNGAVYITSVPTLLEKNSLYGSSIAYYEMSADKHVNLDTLADWKRAEDIYLNGV